jgi:hypothetical protein
MAEQITHDVVKEAQSMGGASPIDDSASTTNTSAGNGEAPSGPTTINSKSSDALSTTNVTTHKPVATGTKHPIVSNTSVSCVWGEAMGMFLTVTGFRAIYRKLCTIRRTIETCERAVGQW